MTYTWRVKCCIIIITSEAIVVTYATARCGVIINNHFTANLPENHLVEELTKSVKI